MSGATFVRFYPGDWRSGCIGLSLDEEGLYWRICAHYYETGVRLPLDDATAAHRIGLNPKNYRRVRDELLAKGKITKHEDGYANRRAELELAHAIRAGRKDQAEVLSADVDAPREAPHSQREDRRDQVSGRGVSGAIVADATEHDRESIANQLPINSESIDDQSSILVENIEQNQYTFIEPRAKSQEPIKETPVAPKGATPLQCLQAFEAYNALALRAGLPQASKLTPGRQRFIRCRIGDYPDGGWDRMLANVEKSAFLTGQNDRGWRVDLDWLVKPANFCKVHDGSYGNGRHAARPITAETPLDRILRARQQHAKSEMAQ